MGGGGGDGGAAQRELDRKKAQADLDRKIRANFFLEGTDTPTDARLSQFADIEQRIRNRFIPDFNELTSDANKELGFTVARRGLQGSSTETDAQSRFARRVTRGEEDIATRVLLGRSAKEQADNSLLTTLFNQSAAGGNADVVLGGINSGLSASAENAVTQATINAVQNPFQDVGNLFKNVNDLSQFTSGQNAQAQKLAALFGGGNTSNVPQGSQGVIT